MNKTLYRIVFNKARGMLMVVAENIAAQGKGDIKATSGDIEHSSQKHALQIKPICFAAKIVVGVMTLAIPLAQAQIIADPNAPGNQRPTILPTANGLPQVNIQTPSAAGVSRNTYKQFDVQSQGAILNNSRTSVQTQTGGWVQANPWLVGGAARVILNEVNSSNPSQLNGYVEVAGQRAEVIIANPAGIQVNGGGFINANKVTLTTGTATINPANGGSLDYYRIPKGTISIDGLGLDTRTADYTDILARSVEVNAGIWANRLKVVTGANQVSTQGADYPGDVAQGVTPIAGTGPVPQFSLDVAALGGMYAGHIYLVGTEAGMGVRNQGAISAGEGNLVLLANGLLTNEGTIQAASSSSGNAGNIRIEVAGPIRNVGADALITAQGHASILTTDDLVNASGANVEATKSLEVVAVSIANAGRLAAGATIAVNASDVDNAVTGEIVGDATTVTAAGDLSNRGLIDGRDTLLTAEVVSNIGTGRIYGDHLGVAAGTLTNDSETINGIRSDAVIAARERLDLGIGTLNNRNGALLFSAGTEEDALNIGRSLDAHGHAAGVAETINNQSATIESLGGAAIHAQQINNLNPDFSTRTDTIVDSVYLHYVQLDGVRYLESALGNCYKCGSDWNDDGTPNRTRYEYVAPSARYPFEAGYSRIPYQLYTYGFRGGRTGNYVYPADSPVWALFGVPVGNQAALRPILENYNWDLMSRARRSFDHIWVTSTQTMQTVVDNSGAPGKIVADGGLMLTGGAIFNDNSQILAGGNLDIAGSSLINTETAGQRIVTDFGTFRRDNVEYSPYALRAGQAGSGNYVSVRESVTTKLDTSRAEGSTSVVGTGTQLAALATPTSSLLHASPDPAATVLYETDPRFANQRQWLSSDYMLQVLATDPTTIQKRLGDGFYEQKLVREQVAQLTGRRFLDGYASDEDQYQALMEAGATTAREWNLIPGVALTAAQMAQLTSDIVWLVAQEVVLPDGTTTTALVPQVYVMPRPGDLDTRGSLLAGRQVDIQLTGDLLNSGTIAGRNVAQINANNVQNLGAITGKAVDVSARQNLSNLGGHIVAEDILVAMAGGDLTVQSTTSTGTASAGLSSSSLTQVDRVAGLYVTGNAGTLVANAGNDLNIVAGVLASAGNLQATADNNVNLETVGTGYASNLTANARNYIRQSGTQETGSQIISSGSAVITAGNDINARAAIVNATEDLAVSAGGDIRLTEGRATSQSDNARYVKRSGFLSSSTTESRIQSQSDTAIGSELGGKTVMLTSGGDTLIRGSSVIGDSDTTVIAGRDLNIEAATNTSQSSSFSQTKRSGLYSGGGLSISYGKQEQVGTRKGEQSSAVASTIGSVDGNVALTAGQTYTQKGSDVLAPGGDIDITAKKVDILAAENAYTNTTEQRFKQSGITLALTGAVISAVQTVQQMAEAASDTQDGRMKALAGASAGLAVMGGYDAIQKGQGVTVGDKTNQIATGNKLPDGSNEYRDATAADQAGGLSISISIGASSSQSKTTQSGTQAVASNITAGGDVRIVAAGAGEDSSLTVQGSNISAANNLTLAAENKLNLIAAQNTDEQHSTNKNSSGSIGLSFGTTTGITVGVSTGRGNADGSDVTWTNTHVHAGNQLALVSGGDANLIGAVASGKQVIADVGGDLNIQSLQDTSQYDSKQKSAGGSFTYGWSTGASGSLNFSKSSVSSDYASVTETSGIKAGDDGFQVNVQGNTDLKGAVIASTEQAVQDGNNSFITASLTMSDIENKADYKADAKGISLGGGSSSGVLNLSGGGIGSDDGHAESTTQSGISGIAGNREVRTGDAEKGIAKIFDAEKVQKEINAQVQITQAFSQQAGYVVETYAEKQMNELRTRYATETDPEKRKAMQAEVDSLRLETSILNILIGAVTGLGSSALAHESLAYASEELRKVTIENSRLSPPIVDDPGNGEQPFTLSNVSGVSAGGKWDLEPIKTGGTRLDLDSVCGADNKRCKTNEDGSLALNDKGQVQWNSDGANGHSLEYWLTTPDGTDMRGLTGGIQGIKGTLFGVPYEAGSLVDKVIEAFGGPHDVIGGQAVGFYDDQGNAPRGRSTSEIVANEIWTAVALAPATPFAAATLLPSEVWQAISILLKGAK